MASTVTLQVWWAGPGRRPPRFRLDGQPITLLALAKLYGLAEHVVLARVARGVHPSAWFLGKDAFHAYYKQELKRAA